MHAVEVHRLQLRGDRPARARSNGAVVEFADRRHLGGGAGKEGLVGDVYLVAGNALLDDLESRLLRQLDDGVAGQADQGGTRVGRIDLPVADDEDVLARAFGDEAVDV